MCALVVGVDELGRWPRDILLAVFFSGGCLTAFFVFWQTRSHKPLLPLDIFHSRRFTLAVISSICMFTAQGLALVALPFLLQHTYRFDVLQAALIFTPWPLAVVVVAPLAGKLTGRIKGTVLASTGVTVLAIGLAALAHAVLAGSYGTLVIIDV